MISKFFSLVVCIFLFSCLSSTHNQLPPQIYGDHYQSKPTITLSSSEGQELYKEIDLKKITLLKKYWQPQKPNFCGVCSAVIVTNSLKQVQTFDQVNFFSAKVKQIIEPDTVEKMGMTLRELHASILSLSPEFNTEKFYAHTSGLDLFSSQLKNYSDSNSLIIVNFSRKSIAGEGMNSGHFSIVAGYNNSKQMVLILEVNGEKESFWISVKDLYTAMFAIDPVSKIPRGWLMVTP